MKRAVRAGSLVSAALMALAACQSDELNAPATSESSAETLMLEPEVSNALIVSLDDAVGRLVPALDDVTSAQDVGLQLARLSKALATGNAAVARDALTAARAALGTASDTPDGAAIALALDRAEALLTSETPRRTR